MAYTPSSTLQAVEALYIGYFGRAGEPGGVAYWVNQINNGQTFAQAAAAFSVQAEAKAQHPFLANPTLVSPADFVESLYSQLFGRASDAAGKAYWVAQLSAANGNPFAYGLIVAQFISGAQNDANGNDLDVIKNKVTAAEYFTGKLATAGIQGTDDKGQVTVAVDAAATDVISGVTKDAASITAANAKTDAFVSTGGGEGTTFTLSVNADGPGAVAPAVNTNGTTKIDIYNGVIDGVASTLTSADNIDGKGGNDTLNVRVITGGAAVAPTLTSVETVNATLVAAVAQEINLASASGVTSVGNVKSISGSAVTFSNVAPTVGIALTDAAGGSNTTVGYTGAAARTGTADAFSLSVSGSGAVGNAATVSLNGDATFEVANITATGKGSVINLVAPGVDTIKATGAATAPTATGFALSLVGSALTNAKNIDASGLTAAGLRVDLGGAGNTKDVTFTGSGFNDAVMMGTGLTIADKLDGKGGTNTIGITNGATLVDGLQVTNFQTLDIGGAFISSTYDVSKLSGITGLQVSAALNQGVGAQVETINNLAKGATVTINAALGFPGDGDGVVINVKDAGAGSPDDTIGVTFNSATALTTFGNLKIADIETVNLNSTSSGTGITHTVTSLEIANALKVTVNASTAGLTINDITDPALVSFDASASVKSVSLTTGADAFAATNGVSFKLGAAADTINLTGATTAAALATTLDFQVQGNGGGDNITLATAGGGYDKIVIAAATDSQVGLTTTGAAKFDTVTNFVATAEDKIDLTAFGFTGTLQNITTSTAGINGNGELTAASDATNFFGTPGLRTGVTEIETGGNTWVYIDVNKDGNLDGGDAAVLLIGVTAANFDNAGIIWS